MELHEMLRMAAKESGYAEDLSDTYLLNKIAEYAANDNACVIHTDKGFIVGVVSDEHLLFPSKLVALEVSWWVMPEHRGSKEGYTLYKWFEEWARYKGAEVMFQGKKTKDAKKIGEIYLREI